MKPGWQTSEFYMACGAQIAQFVAAFQSDDIMMKITTGVTATVCVIFYLWTRYQLKTMPIVPPVVPPVAPSVFPSEPK